MLDARTVKPENITITSAGTNVPAEVTEAKYYPLTNSVSCIVKTPYSLLTTTYNVTTNGLKDINGETADFSGEAEIKAEYTPDLYDVSVLSVAYLQNGKLTYTQPASGACSVLTTLVNSATEMKKVTLVYSLRTSSGKEIVLLEKTIEVDGETKITDIYELTVTKKQTVNVYIK